MRFKPELLEAMPENFGFRGKIQFEDPAKRDAGALAAMQRFIASVASARDALTVECAYAEAAGTVLTQLGGCSYRPPSDGLCHSGVRAVREHLRRHLTERTALAELAELAKLSRFGLCQAFRARLGVSPGQYWQLCRVSKGRELVQQGVPAKQVAHDLGFADEPQFNRIFKRVYGVPPGRWARMSRANSIF